MTQLAESSFEDVQEGLAEIIASVVDVTNDAVTLSVGDDSNGLSVEVSIQTDATQSVEDIIDATQDFLDAINAGLQASADAVLAAAQVVDATAADVVQLAKYLVQTTLQFMDLTADAF